VRRCASSEIRQHSGRRQFFSHSHILVGYALAVSLVFSSRNNLVMPNGIASRIVTPELQEQFAVLSGDRNPLHMDAIAARRTRPGLPVVHGVHTLLWALEFLVASGHLLSPLSRIKAKFLQWIYLGDEAVLSLPFDAKPDPRLLKVEVLGLPVLSVELQFGTGASTEPKSALIPSPAAPLPAALDISFADLDNRSGHAFTATEASVRRFFPQLTASIGPAAVAEIVACSYVVGMEAPGLHSMLSKLDLTIARPSPSEGVRTALHYLVLDRDERFRKARIAVDGCSVTGTLDAFIRVPPVEQPSMQALASHVSASEFADIDALIIGGSRGLGELTAKLIAAGGGKSTITYAVGKIEAESVASQIRARGSGVQVLPYDVRMPPPPQLAGLTKPFSHLFYFATNAIFRPKKNLVSPPVLADFIAFYVIGFHEICLYLTQAERASAGKLIAYYPSSVAVEERPAGMTEYAMAKAAGEQMCRDMNQSLPNLHILTSRLPRLLTDQTAGIMPERALDPIGVLLPIVREMRGLSRGF